MVSFENFIRIEVNFLMKKRLKTISRKLMGVLPALAMMLAVQSVSATCFFCLHQPDVPEGLMQHDK